MRRYRGRYVIVAVLGAFELPVVAALALGAIVTRLVAALASVVRRVGGRRE